MTFQQVENEIYIELWCDQSDYEVLEDKWRTEELWIAIECRWTIVFKRYTREREREEERENIKRRKEPIDDRW